jgi:ribosomal protein S18 acetylase RimI-like enzyme
MNYIKAGIEHADEVYGLLKRTISSIYPKYYPKEIVDFFLDWHRKENIQEDILQSRVWILYDNDELVGTGSIKENHITRVYVSPEFQGKGYGSYIMDSLEKEIGNKYDRAILDASLPACSLYSRRGYKTIEHHKLKVENGAFLVYEVMEKELLQKAFKYDGKKFAIKTNTDNGEVSLDTIFEYHQNENIIWAEYSGGDIIKGNLLGNVNTDFTLDFFYHHINIDGKIRIGKCHSVPVITSDNKLELHEDWQWLDGDKTRGKSILYEVD